MKAYNVLSNASNASIYNRSQHEEMRGEKNKGTKA